MNLPANPIKKPEKETCVPDEVAGQILRVGSVLYRIENDGLKHYLCHVFGDWFIIKTPHNR